MATTGRPGRAYWYCQLGGWGLYGALVLALYTVKETPFLRMALQPPLRFFRDYVLHLGFLDGAKGLQLAWRSAFYTFMKQARLWELHYGMQQTDVEPEAIEAAERRAAAGQRPAGAVA